MTRKQALSYARIAGYHRDARTYTRLTIEARVNRRALQEAWAEGELAKDNGMPCACQECR